MRCTAYTAAILLVFLAACSIPRGGGGVHEQEMTKPAGGEATAQAQADGETTDGKEEDGTRGDTALGRSPRITGARGYDMPEYAEEVFQKRISLTVKDADLENVIRLLARQAGLNIIINPVHVKGRVTVQLHNVPVGAALRVILRSNGLELVRDPGSMFRIAPGGVVGLDPNREKAVIHVPLSWVSAEDVKRTLDPIVDGEIVADPHTNSIIIADSPKKIEEIVRIIHGRDTANE